MPVSSFATGPTGPSPSISGWVSLCKRRCMSEPLNLLARRLPPAYRPRGSRRRHLREIEQECRAIPEGETIFVSIASYRDPQCPETVFDIFEKAACPFRVFVGVCQQNHGSDPDVLERYRELVGRRGVRDFSDHIRIYAMDADQAQGPMLGRHLVEKHLYRDERYYLIIDSHTMFTRRWDAKCVEMWNRARKLSPKPVLTMYPKNVEPFRRRWPLRDFENMPLTCLRFKKFNEDSGLVQIKGADLGYRPEQPVLSLFWGACFSFGSGSQIREVPFDPHCPYVFLGEEISMAARLWTWGYDFFHPTLMVIFHVWERRRPLFFQQFDGDEGLHRQRRELRQEGYRRLQTLLGLRAGRVEAPYGLGEVRTLAEYERFMGIDMRRRVVTTPAGLPDSAGKVAPDEAHAAVV